MNKLLKLIVIINLFLLSTSTVYALPIDKIILQAQAKDCMDNYHACYLDCSSRYMDLVSTTELSTIALNCYKKCVVIGKPCSKILKKLKEYDQPKIYPIK